MRPRTIALLLGLAALVAVLVVGLSQRPKDESGDLRPLPLAEQQQRLAGSPPALAALHAQANELLGGGQDAIDARLEALRGRPVVLNKWASWCAPCRAEFAMFQHAGASFGRRVAFLGLNSSDFGRRAAAAFLAKRPVSYPSYTDPKGKAALALRTGSNFPVTVFYDASGRRRYMRQGGYPSLEKLEQDIRRYALATP